MAIAETQAATAVGDAPSPTGAAKSKDWNWHPDLPTAYAPILDWPFRPLAFAKWFAKKYLWLSDRTVYIAFAFAVAFWIQPVAPEQAALSADWVLPLLVRNAIALLVVAGGLHLWFYRFGKQGEVLKYDRRPMPRRKMAKYKFGYQTWDNMYYSLAWGLPIASAYEVLCRLLFAQGALPAIGFAGNEFWFLALFPLLLIWQSLHFYVIHRLLHWTPLYRWVHAVHHRNANPGPWSGISMHPVEHLLYFSTLLIFLVLPAHPVHMLFLLFWQFLGAPSSHSGYESIWVRGRERLVVGDFFHQLHHKYFTCNYGGIEVPLDKWFGTYLDGTPEGMQAFRKRAAGAMAQQSRLAGD